MAPKRKGGGTKGFLKTAVRAGAEQEDDAAPREAAPAVPQSDADQSGANGAGPASDVSSAKTPASTEALAASASTAPVANGAASAAEPSKPLPGAEPGEGGSGGGGGDETRGQMLQRHKKEAKALKDTAKKMGKKRKDEAAALEADMEARHAKELQALDDRVAAEQGDDGLVDAVAAALAANSLYGRAAEEDSKQEASRAQKRKAKAAAAAAEREARIAEENAAAGSSARVVEEAALRDVLRPLGLGVRDIPPDGNCLYRAVEDQLRLSDDDGPDGDGAAVPSHSDLRRQAVAHMREHEDDFLPFFAQEGGDEDGEVGDDAHARFEAYCSEMASTAAWGGQLELNALAQALRRRILVYAVGLDPVEMGTGDGGKEALRLCYLRHAYGMGEHYNSVVGAQATVLDDAEMHSDG